MKRVVVTGLGIVTSLGSSVELTWSNILDGQSGIRHIPESMFDVSDIPSKIAGYVRCNNEGADAFNHLDFDIAQKDVNRCDKFIIFAMAAAHQAMRDSGLVIDSDEDSYRSGVLIGGGIGGLLKIQDTTRVLFDQEKGGVKRVSPFFIPASLINLSSGHVSIRHNLKGPNYGIVSACASSTHAIGEAARLISCGDADVMVCGGSEAAICRLGMTGFARANTLSTSYNDRPSTASRPWDKGRDGFVMGEGSGILVLEEYEKAKKRGAKIYGEVAGYGLTGDAHHITSPHPNGEGQKRSMIMAMNKAHVTPEEIDYINAHGTSTPAGDMMEYHAIADIFSNNKKLAVSSSKSALGHLLGGAGAVEAIITLMAMHDNTLPPTLNLDNPEDECSINLVPHTAQQQPVNMAMSNSFGFGGTNSTILFKKL